MLIARLIADIDDWETRLKKMNRQLSGFHQPIGGEVHPESAIRLPIAQHVFELHFRWDDRQVALNYIDANFGPCDVLLSKERIVVPRLFVSDMDSTMIGQECIDELADFAGLKEQISDITERAMQGELDFEDALRERVALLEGLEESAIERCLSERITPTSGAATLSATLKAHGSRNVLVTGGFHHFGDVVGEWLGFDRVVGNRLAVVGGKITGQLDGAVTDADTKRTVLIDEAAKIGTHVSTLATGDGANDIPMIEAASYGFAYHAKPKARSAANGRVDHGDLTAILSLLGIDRKDWVEG